MRGSGDADSAAPDTIPTHPSPNHSHAFLPRPIGHFLRCRRVTKFLPTKFWSRVLLPRVLRVRLVRFELLHQDRVNWSISQLVWEKAVT